MNTGNMPIPWASMTKVCKWGLRNLANITKDDSCSVR